jgi:PhnB protein
MNQRTNRASSPTAYTITPHLVVGGAAQAADWYQQAFGAQVGARIPVPGGKFIQIEVRLGDSTVMLADEFPGMGVLSPLTLGGTYGALDIATEDVDALWDRALAAGATLYQPLQGMCWGDRRGQLIDPFGHRSGILSTSATFRPRRSPEPRQRCSTAGRADDAARQVVSSDPACASVMGLLPGSRPEVSTISVSSRGCVDVAHENIPHRFKAGAATGRRPNPRARWSASCWVDLPIAPQHALVAVWSSGDRR